jgi:hypothetical protein
MGVVYHGERFAGHRLVEVIGSTARATVHRAVDPDGRTVALRILDSRPDALTRQRCLREWAIARDLRHPHIVPVYDMGEAEGRLFIAMRYVPGSTLATLLAEGPRLDPDRVAALLGGVADALDAAHAQGLVHGDVTPGGILVDATGGRDHAYLTGFGAEAPSTAEYAAPEQIDGGGVDGRTDVYALGRVVHRCLGIDSGRVSAGLEEIVARAVARPREDRYPTATAFLAAVHRALGELDYRDPEAAALRRRPAAPRPLWPWSPLVAAALSATALAATTGLVVGIHHARPSGASTTPPATALAPRIPTQLLAPGAATAQPSPAPAVEASPTPAEATTPAPPTPAVAAPVAATASPAPPTQAPVVAISPPLSGGVLFSATVRNTGATDLVAGASTLTNPAAAAIVTDGCAGVHLAPGGSCQVTVRVQASAPGSAAGALSVPLSDGKPVTFILGGFAP